MTLAKRIIQLLALLFVVTSISSVLFWPTHKAFIFDDILFPFGVIQLAFVFFTQKKWRWIILLFIIMGAWGFICDILANGEFRTAPIGMILRWFKWPILIVVLGSCNLAEIKKLHIVNGMKLLFLGVAAVNIILLINPFHIGEEIHTFYSPKPESLLGNYHEIGAFRLTGLMINPNNNGATFALFLFFFLQLNLKKYWKYCLLAFIFIFLTQSRTVLITTVILIGIIFVKNNDRKTNMILIPSAILGLFTLLFFFRSTNLMAIFSGGLFKSGSWTQRIDHYSHFFNGSTGDKLFGHGIILNPMKIFGVHFDSEYLSILMQYGIIGLLIWLSAVFYIPILTRKITGFSFFGWLLTLFILITSVTNTSLSNSEVIPLLAVVLGAWLFLKRKDEIHNHSK